MSVEKQINEVDTITVKFAGDSGDGIQLTGDQFGNTTAIAGNDFATFPDFPSEIRAPLGTTYGVSSYQIQFAAKDIYTPGDTPEVLVCFNPAALKVNIGIVNKGGLIIVNEDEFTDKNLKKAGFETNPLDPDDDIELEFDIQKIFTLNTLETKKEFHGEAQVPTCYFLLKNTKNTKKTKIYDQINKKYIRFVPNNTSLPLNTVSIIKKLQKYVKKYGCLKVEKTNIRPERVKKLTLSNDNTNNCIYPNIYTCKLTKIKPYLDIKYSNIKLPYYGEKKIVLAHKMYGFPYYDKDGIYGICGRDNFVILNKSDYEFVRLKQFLSSKLFLSLTETTRYRMTYLEKVLFDFIPDITKIKNFPDIITNESINKYFGLDKLEIDILNSHKKIYLLDKI